MTIIYFSKMTETTKMKQWSLMWIKPCNLATTFVILLKLGHSWDLHGSYEVLGTVRMHQGVSIKMTKYYQTACEVIVFLILYHRYHFEIMYFLQFKLKGILFFFFGKGIKMLLIIQVPKKGEKNKQKDDFKF